CVKHARMNLQRDAFTRLDRNISGFGLRPYISELVSSIVQWKLYAKSGSRCDISYYDKIKRIDRLRASVRYLKFKLPRPFLVLQIFKPSFLLLLDLYFYWHVLRY